MGECWDIYNKDRKKTGEIIERNSKRRLKEGEFHIAVTGVILNSKNQILITKRSPDKPNYPKLWECTSGSVVVGEDSQDAVIREVNEEIGIKFNKNEAKFLGTIQKDNCFKDIWLFVKDVVLEEITYCDEEVVDSKWVSIAEYNTLLKNQNIVPSGGIISELIQKKYIKRKRGRTIMGNQKSKLDKKIIEKILLQKYNIKIDNAEEINRGTANIFVIFSGSEKFILKEFSENRTIESIMKEVQIINYLKYKEINVPEYIKTNDGKYYITNEDRVIIMQKFIDGYTLENNTVSDKARIIESATILGKVTKELGKYHEFEDEQIILKQFSKQSIENGLEKMLTLKESIKKDNIYKEKILKDLDIRINIANYLLKKFNFNFINKMTNINGHGDYSIQQLIYNDKCETTVIDFETVKKLPIAWEVIRSYSYIDSYCKNGELNIDTFAEYVKEFCNYIKLNEYDLKYIAHLYLIQLVKSMFGYKEYNQDYSQKELLDFAFFRTKLCENLYKNLDVIGEAVLQNYR